MIARWGLEHWGDLATEDWPNLLVGNGLSVAVSPTFAYTSLYDVAELDSEEQALFRALGTTNFELVLDHLRSTKVVCEQLHGSSEDVEARYDSIRERLLAAVDEHHAGWEDVPTATLQRIRDGLRGHRRVWTTSYDLIPYWAIMSSTPPGAGFADAFSHGTFDPVAAEPNQPDTTQLWWSHGALHLYRLHDGSTVKQQYTPGANLLALLRNGFDGADTPMFVSEGTSVDKLRVIRGSDYLNYAYNELARTEGGLVVFGQRLGQEVEQHVISAIGRQPGRAIAYGIHAADQGSADLEKARITYLLPNAELRFYDSRTHPLAGSSPDDGPSQPVIDEPPQPVLVDGGEDTDT